MDLSLHSLKGGHFSQESFGVVSLVRYNVSSATNALNMMCRVVDGGWCLQSYLTRFLLGVLTLSACPSRDSNDAFTMMQTSTLTSAFILQPSLRNIRSDWNTFSFVVIRGTKCIVTIVLVAIRWAAKWSSQEWLSSLVYCFVQPFLGPLCSVLCLIWISVMCTTNCLSSSDCACSCWFVFCE